MYPLIVIGAGLTVGLIRCFAFRRGKTSKKVRYYNYSKYAIRHKKVSKNLEEQSKITF